MISNHKIQAALDEIKEISKIDLALYTDKGKQVAATFETEGDMEYAVNSFAGSMAESQMLSSWKGRRTPQRSNWSRICSRRRPGIL